MYGHLCGVDRLRLVAIYSDGRRLTESFDETTEDAAKATAAALCPPPGVAGHGDDVTGFEVFLGQWSAIGSTDCEWTDTRAVCQGRVTCEGVGWSAAAAPGPDPLTGDQMKLI